MKPNNFSSFKDREDFGLANERHLKNEIDELFEDWGELHWNKDKYATFDFENHICSVELKGRTCYSHTYPTAIIGYNKIKEGMTRVKNGKQVFFLWSYKDGLFMWELNLNSWLLIGGRNSITETGCNARYGNKMQNCEIPYKFLEKVSNIPTIDR